ncbi:MAG: hypothetical protein KME60_01090 [Cyanomargarita calcarea GSE-NOS-MK-12-04C]|uniref:Uncharacterized protein n=1 Tax=Cyanomargarita calcarea GSE-NOS-MK-12-04C TaxID=2839659 RepID=A0A951URA2_9CYAN|nr:hypothetical protein [Cyanomargarita calcarea GSE-NOS-MK-12-04C]
MLKLHRLQSETKRSPRMCNTYPMRSHENAAKPSNRSLKTSTESFTPMSGREPGIPSSMPPVDNAAS